MDSLFLAKFIGIFCLIMSLSMFLRRKMLLTIFHELSLNRTLVYIIGVTMVMIGLMLVLNFNLWTSGFPLFISALGWLILIEGISYLFLSKKTLKKYMNLMNKSNIYNVIALSYLAIGMYMIFVGFSSPY